MHVDTMSGLLGLNARWALVAMLLAVAGVLRILGWVIRKRLLPARLHLTRDIAVGGLRSDIAGQGSKFLPWAGAFGVVVGVVVGSLQAVKATFSAGKPEDLTGFIQAAVHSPLAVEFSGAGIAAFLAAIALRVYSERAIARWAYRLTYMSKMKLNVEELAMLTISPHEGSKGRKVEAAIDVIGINFTIRPEHIDLKLGAEDINEEIRLAPRELGQQRLEIKFKDKEGRRLGGGERSIWVFEDQFWNWIVPNRALSVARVLSYLLGLAGAILGVAAYFNWKITL